MPESFVPPQGIISGDRVVVYGLPVGIPSNATTRVVVKAPPVYRHECMLKVKIIDMQGATPFEAPVVEEKFETLSFGGKVAAKVVTPVQVPESAKTSAFKVDPVVLVLKAGSNMQIQ